MTSTDNVPLTTIHITPSFTDVPDMTLKEYDDGLINFYSNMYASTGREVYSKDTCTVPSKYIRDGVLLHGTHPMSHWTLILRVLINQHTKYALTK